jgi:transcriptional regulator CtsR
MTNGEWRMNERNAEIRMPTDERGCELESRRSGGAPVRHSAIRHSFELHHLDFVNAARLTLM